MIQSSTLPTRGEHVIAQAAPESVIVFHLESGEYYSLDEVGCRIWELCDGCHTVAQIVDMLCGEYSAPRAKIHDDVLELVAMLETEGLIDGGSVQIPGPEQGRQPR